MGATNNSLVKIQDIVRSGGIKTENFSIDENKLLNDIEITSRQPQESGQIHLGPLCYNVTLKNEYGKDHLTKFQDLDIAKTYPITLKVSIPNGMTGYTLHGFTAKVTYPNSSVKSHSINITETTSNTDIVLQNCCDNAKVKVSVSAENSGATISNSRFSYKANVSTSLIFTRGSGLTCTGTNVYSCFTLTDTSTTGSPITPDPGITPKRSIDIFVKTGGLYKLFIGTAKYATGTTESEVQDYNSLTQASIPELSKEIVGLSSSGIQATISVPADSYVAIYLADPLGSRSSTEDMTQYAWVENNAQYVSSGYTRESVTYTVTIKN